VKFSIDANCFRFTNNRSRLGSGSVVQQLTRLGLVSHGKNAFKGVDTAELKLSESGSFKNDLVWLTYERV
jgi:hypothetical protein